MRRVSRGRSVFSGLIMCGGGVYNILLFPHLAGCLEHYIYACIWRMFVFMSFCSEWVVSVGMFVV